MIGRQELGPEPGENAGAVLGFISGGRTGIKGGSFVNGDIDTLLASAFEQIAVIASASVTGRPDAGKLLFCGEIQLLLR